MTSLHWINKARWFACIVVLPTAAILSHATAPPVAALVCNGADYLCERRYDQVIFPTNHNSHAYKDADAPTWATANQNKTIPEQLRDGVRGLMWDAHYKTISGFTNVALCHEPPGVSNCPGGFRYLFTALGYLKTFLDANPGEVVTIIFESYVKPADLVTVFTDAGLAAYLFSHTAGQAWPTLGEMVTSGRRLVVFVSNLEVPDGSKQDHAIGPNGAWSGADSPGYEHYGQWLHSEWSLAFETPFDYAIYSGPLRGLGEDKPAYCMPHLEDKPGFTIRGNPLGLYVLNHFITPPGTTEADNTNPYGFLLRSARYCGTIYHRLPNFLTVDFYNHPHFDMLAVADRLNRTALVCPAFLTQRTDPGRCSATLQFPPLMHDATLDCQLSANIQPGDPRPVGTYSPGGVADTVCGESENGVVLSQHCSFNITVYDAEAPQIHPTNLVRPTDTGRCSATVHVPPPPITDNCAAPAVSSGTRSDGAALTAAYPLGVTTITWQGVDTAGLLGHATQTITITDTEKPVVACGVSASALWPKNAQLVPVGFTASGSDNCGTSPLHVRVFSNEDDVGAASHPRFSPDAADIAPGTLRLRAEADRHGDGRVYLIVTETEDNAGNAASCAQTVVVPKNQSPAAVTFVQGQAAQAKAYYETHGQAPAGFVLVGDGPVIGPKQ